MKITWMFGLAALAANLNAGHGTAIGEGASAAPDVTVYVDGAGGLFNFQTRILADRMLAAAGVRVEWRAGAPKEDPAPGLVIKVQFAGANKVPDFLGALAHAYVFGRGVRNITVFHHRLRATAASAGVEDYRLTAHVLAHEIVHVLQRIDRHSDSGLMKARWTHADLVIMSRKTLPITQEDVKFMRLGIDAVRDQDQALGTK